MNITNESYIKTSIIIPIYNTRQYLKECIESVLAQTQKEIEIILVDDGSTDGSSELIRAYEKKYWFVKGIYQKNQKLGAARNAGVKAATGKYIYFLDSDDYIDRSLLEECYQAAEEKCLDYIMFDAKTFCDVSTEMHSTFSEEAYDRSKMKIESKIYSGIEFWKEFYACGGVYPNAVLVYINANFFRENNLFFEKGIFYEDNDWMLRMCLCAKKIAYIPQRLYYRRYRVESITMSAYSYEHVQSCIVICRKLIQMLKEDIIPIKKGMIMSRLIAILNLFIQIYNKYDFKEENTIAGMEFYEFLLGVYKEINSISEMAGDIIIKATGLIEKVLQDRNFTVNNEFRRQIICKRFSIYPLDKKEVTVGIYGTGKVSMRFLSAYKEYVSKIMASIFFVDTYKKSGERCGDYIIYNIKDMDKIYADRVIIASTRYEDELFNNIQEYFPKELIMTVPKI